MIGFLRENGRWIAGGFLLTYASSFGQTFFVSASVSEWQEVFGLSHGDFGGLYFIATLGSAACLPFVGKLVDVMPEHRVIMLCGSILTAATLLAAFAPTVVLLTLALFLLRLFGQGMMTQIALTATGRWFAAQRGRAVSLVAIGVRAGEATLPLLATAIGLAFGWRMGWIGGAALLGLVILPFAVWAYRQPRTPRGTAPTSEGTQRQWTRSEVLRDPFFYLLLTGVLAPPFIGTTIFFHQDYLTEFREWPATLFASGLTIMALTTITVALLVGGLIDRVGSLRVLPFFLLPLGAASVAIALLDGAWGVFIFMPLLGVSYGVSSTLFGSLWPEIYGTKNLGAIRSVTVSFIVFSTAVGPWVTSVLIDRGVTLPAQLLALAGYCFVVAGLMATISPRLLKRQAAASASAG